MSLPLRFHPAVQNDVLAVDQWYEQRSPGRGRKFMFAVDQALAKIQQNPVRHGYVDDPTHAADMIGFPYIIYYEVEPTTTYVIAIQHYARDPAAWQSRR